MNIISGQLGEEPEISVVVPVYNEDENIPILGERLLNVFRELGVSHEIIFVDDGSTDLSLERILDLRKSHAEVKAIHFRANRGKSAALAAGFRQARGRKVATMDADFQEPPEEIPALMRNLDNGLDVVSGWRVNRRDPKARIWASKMFNWLVRAITRTGFRDVNCGFKIFRREVVKRIEVYGDLHRVIPILAYKEGFRVGEMQVSHSPRIHGESKFTGMTRGLHGIFDLVAVLFLANYQKRPLHFFGMTGFVMFSGGVAIDLFLTLRYLFGFGYIGERLPLFMLGILLMLLGFQSFCMGLLGEMLTRRNMREPAEKDLEKYL
ncbi:MAG: glycosyltransferase family 2 protein [Nitrospinae bacterium]|nr:glycosyltransferase family 2 protein [Nitrospinota bacterium]